LISISVAASRGRTTITSRRRAAVTARRRGAISVASHALALGLTLRRAGETSPTGTSLSGRPRKAPAPTTATPPPTTLVGIILKTRIILKALIVDRTRISDRRVLIV
jgi:hypothetical protein